MLALPARRRRSSRSSRAQGRPAGGARQRMWAGSCPTRRDDFAQLPNGERGHQHGLGNEGMPRRYDDYLPTEDLTALNALSSTGAFVLGASTLPFLGRRLQRPAAGRPSSTTRGASGASGRWVGRPQRAILLHGCGLGPRSARDEGAGHGCAHRSRHPQLLPMPAWRLEVGWCSWGRWIPTPPRCPRLWGWSTSGKEWTLTRPRDLPVGGTGVVLLQWRKRRWRCGVEACARVSFTERTRLSITS